MREHRCTLSISIPFCEETLTVDVEGTYFPRIPAFTPRGEYAPIDPPEPAAFEVTKIWCRSIEISWLFDECAMEFVANEALRECENSDIGGPDPDAAYEEMRDRRMEQF